MDRATSVVDRRLALALSIIFILSTTIVITVFHSGILYNDTPPTTNITSLDQNPSSDPPINIGSESDLRNLDLPGNGSRTNPYRIENLTIPQSLGCITIRDVSSYVLIRNCNLGSGGPDFGSYGIVLNQVKNCIIENCSFSVMIKGIEIRTSSNCSVQYCQFPNVFSTSLALSSALNCTIRNNSIDGMYIAIHSSSSCIFDGNVLGETEISVYRSRNLSFNNNTFRNGGLDIYGQDVEEWSHSATNCTIRDKPILIVYGLGNTSIDAKQYSQIIIGHSENVTIRNGRLYGTQGVTMGFCSDLEVSNMIICNAYRGIGIIKSKKIRIYNCQVLNTSSFGMNVHASSEVMIEDCIISGCGDTALRVGSSSYCIVSNISCSHSVRAIQVMKSTRCQFEKNTVFSCGESAFFLWHSRQIIIHQNTISKCSSAIHFCGSDYCTATQNTVFQNGRRGIYVFISDYATVENNTVYGNAQLGVGIDYSIGSTVAGNNISRNGRDGVVIAHSESIQVLENKMEQNNRSGLRFRDSQNCFVRNNTIVENKQYGIILDSLTAAITLYQNAIGWNLLGNALDNGTRNYWDNGIDTGNSWSDYLSTGVYEIPGTAGSVDHYPLVLIEIPHFCLLDFDVLFSRETSLQSCGPVGY